MKTKTPKPRALVLPGPDVLRFLAGGRDYRKALQCQPPAWATEVRIVAGGLVYRPVNARQERPRKRFFGGYTGNQSDDFGGWHGLRGRCPFGPAGTLLAARERYALSAAADHYATSGSGVRVRQFTKGERLRGDVALLRADDVRMEVMYEADMGEATRNCAPAGFWRPARTMPAWAVRLWLEVVDVRVERNAAGTWEWVVGLRRATPPGAAPAAGTAGKVHENAGGEWRPVPLD